MEVRYKLTGEKVPEEIAIAILNDLIEKGFSGGIYLEYKYLLGAGAVSFIDGYLYITEAIKNDD